VTGPPIERPWRMLPVAVQIIDAPGAPGGWPTRADARKNRGQSKRRILMALSARNRISAPSVAIVAGAANGPIDFDIGPARHRRRHPDRRRDDRHVG